MSDSQTKKQEDRMAPYEETTRWPMRADHITSDGSAMGLEGEGIITNRELQGFQSEISSEVGNSTTIIEFTLDGKAIRTDSPFIDLAMHPACRIFRQNNSFTATEGELIRDDKTKMPITGVLCRYCDQCHARLFYGLDETKLTLEEITQRKESDEDLQALYGSAVDCIFQPQFHDKRLYLQYDCPLLGFRELLFPVVFEKRVIAVFFTGQLTLKGKEDLITEMIGNVGQRFPNCFAYAKIPNVVQAIQNAQTKWINGQIEYERPALTRVITDELYASTIRDVFNGIRNLEERLTSAFTHRRHEYIRKSIEHESEMKEVATSARLSKGQNAEVVDDTPLIDLWDEFEKSLDHLVGRFSLRYALALGPSRIVNVEQDVIKVQAKAGRWKEVFSQETLNDLQIAIRGLPNEGYIVCSPTQETNKNHLNLLQGCKHDALGDFQLVILPVSQHPSSSIAVLLGYPESRDVALSNLPEHAPHDYLHQTMKAFFSVAVLAVAATRTRGLEELAKKQLMYMGHEAGQLSGGLDWLTKYYEDAKEFEERLKRQHPQDNVAVIRGLRKKIEDLCADIRGYTGQMFFVFDTAERLGSDVTPQVEPSLFRPYGDVLAKWKDTYLQEFDKKRLQMRVELPDLVGGSRSNDPWRPAMWGDRFLFEQVVYNIVNNAEKYCYRGTKIDMDCKLKGLDEGAPHVLTIIDYGLPLDPADENLFAPFKRGRGSGDVSGLGLGLYIARIIVENIYKGKIEALCDEKPISRFNAPLIKSYIKRSFMGKDEMLIPQLRDELSRLERERLYDSIVAYEPETSLDLRLWQKIPRYNPEDDALLNEIHKPTYKVTIRAEIPPLSEVEVTK